MRLQTMIDVLNEWARNSGVGPDAQVLVTVNVTNSDGSENDYHTEPSTFSSEQDHDSEKLFLRMTVKIEAE